MPDDNRQPRSEELRTSTCVYDAVQRADAASGHGLPGSSSEPVVRADGTPVRLDCLRHLMEEFHLRKENGSFTDRSHSDRWLAPRLHYSLRLDRTRAADKGLWHWLAVAELHGYVDWRWGTGDGIAANRWYGPVHKQALARLWWGAEIFRDGSDYMPVEYAFIRQDLPNSYLHRPLVRCRPFALGIVNALIESAGGTGSLESLSYKTVNDLARVLNLCTAGRPPEAVTRFQVDDLAAIGQWTATDTPIPPSWDPRPAGPPAHDTDETSVRLGTDLARHGLSLTALGQ